MPFLRCLAAHTPLFQSASILLTKPTARTQRIADPTLSIHRNANTSCGASSVNIRALSAGTVLKPSMMGFAIVAVARQASDPESRGTPPLDPRGRSDFSAVLDAPE